MTSTQVHSVIWSRLGDFTYVYHHPPYPWLKFKHASDVETPQYLQDMINREQDKLPSQIVNIGSESVTVAPMIDHIRIECLANQWRIQLMINTYVNGNMAHGWVIDITKDNDVYDDISSFLAHASEIEKRIEPQTIIPEKDITIGWPMGSGPVKEWHKKQGIPVGDKVKLEPEKRDDE